MNSWDKFKDLNQLEYEIQHTVLTCMGLFTILTINFELYWTPQSS